MFFRSVVLLLFVIHVIKRTAMIYLYLSSVYFNFKLGLPFSVGISFLGKLSSTSSWPVEVNVKFTIVYRGILYRL